MAKKIGITVGTFVMICYVALYILTGIDIESRILPRYAIIAYAAAQGCL